jgi:hypothetical protein
MHQPRPSERRFANAPLPTEPRGTHSTTGSDSTFPSAALAALASRHAQIYCIEHSQIAEYISQAVGVLEAQRHAHMLEWVWHICEISQALVNDRTIRLKAFANLAERLALGERRYRMKEKRKNEYGKWR